MNWSNLQQTENNDEPFICPNCLLKIDPQLDTCPGCKTEFHDDAEESSTWIAWAESEWFD
jgi:predicted amidophosphoribosyltransferase